jgi:iron-sulfur cluster repair protein YtfE (RIC family)
MKITDAFLGEHGVFYAQFDALDSTLGGEPGLDVVRAQVALLDAALAPHAQLENELLFEPLAEALGDAAGPVPVMLAEHDEIDAMLQRAARATSAQAARDLLRRVVELARDHFEKEERIAFPLAESVLSAEKLRRLGEEWSRRRRVSLGAAGPPGTEPG